MNRRFRKQFFERIAVPGPSGAVAEIEDEAASVCRVAVNAVQFTESVGAENVDSQTACSVPLSGHGEILCGFLLRWNGFRLFRRFDSSAQNMHGGGKRAFRIRTAQRIREFRNALFQRFKKSVELLLKRGLKLKIFRLFCVADGLLSGEREKQPEREKNGEMFHVQ